MFLHLRKSKTMMSGFCTASINVTVNGSVPVTSAEKAATGATLITPISSGYDIMRMYSGPKYRYRHNYP